MVYLEGENILVLIGNIMNYEEEQFQALTEEFNKQCETFSYLKAEYDKLKSEHLLVKEALQYNVTMPQLLINTFVPTDI